MALVKTRSPTCAALALLAGLLGTKSSSDIVARLVAQKLSERLGQPLVVENRVGGGGGIGSSEVAHADADGYTLGLANTSTHAVAPSVAPLPYDPVKDFAPVSCWATRPSCSPSTPACPHRACKS